jgi:DNA polymerase III subunit gamma/tau
VSHTALARKYRPRRFEDLAGQGHAAETIRRAVATDRVGHAYLFCGPRGVGKTSLARLLAMALNCSSRTDDGEPCGECPSCQKIWSGSTSLDVVEIDAASNRGVDDARDLRERAMYAPSEEGRHKVYILDEAHMLTREAWNALLKILEEPPSRVHFIFATTEPQKIEQTAAPILSRCQRFDFRRVGTGAIVARLEEVLEREGTSAADEALRIIARKADGGMRDGLSLLDQVLALSEDGITVEAVRRVLGVVEEQRFLELFDLLARRDRDGLFRLVETLLEEGYDLVEFYHGLMDSLRTLLRLRVGGDVESLAEERKDEWAARAAAFEAADLLRMLGMASELETGGSLRRTTQPRVLLELLLLRFSYLDRTLEVESLLRAVGGEKLPPPAPGGAPSPARPARPAPAPESAAPPVPPPSASPAPAAPPASPSPPSSSAPEAAVASSPAPAPQADLAEAWKAMLADGGGVPPGLGTLLRGAPVRAMEGDVLEVELIPGPALERLQDDAVRVALEAALGPHFAGTPKLRIREGDGSGTGAGSGGRISQGEVRTGLLQDLLEKEPGLRPAVEELDLELMD